MKQIKVSDKVCLSKRHVNDHLLIKGVFPDSILIRADEIDKFIQAVIELQSYTEEDFRYEWEREQSEAW